MNSFDIIEEATTLPGHKDDFDLSFPEILPEIYRNEFHKVFKRQVPFLLRYRQHRSGVHMISRTPTSQALRELKNHLTVSFLFSFRITVFFKFEQ